jgi:Flp pilus assembly pilin Flp
MEVSMPTRSTGEQGQALSEYAVVLAVITILILGAIQALSGQIAAMIGVVAAGI